MVKYCRWCLIALICILQPRILPAQHPTLPPDLDEYIHSVLKTFEVPGLGLSIVQHGKTILVKGYGVKKTGTATPVDAHTLFPIASNSKAFTGTALAMLVEEGKIKWEDPVISHLSWFRMSDPWVTAQITVRDLLVHHSGIAAYAADVLVFPPSDYSRKEILWKVRDLPLVNGFRSSYAYDNILYLAAGEIIKKASGMEWEDFIQQRILLPLNMQETISRFSLFREQVNVSAAHSRLKGKVTVDELFAEQAMGDAGNPAGGIISNAWDMGKWMITQLDSGMASSGKRLFKPSSAAELWKIVTPVPITKMPPGMTAAQMNFSGYALGFRSYNYGAYKIVGHGGKLDGFVSQLIMVPELKLGITVLTNQESTGAYWSVIFHLLDHFLQNPPTDWQAEYKTLLDSSLAKSARARATAILPQKTIAPASLNPVQYTGNYTDALYGGITISGEGEALQLKFNHTPQLVAKLMHFQYDTFIAHFNNKDLKADAYVSFSLGPDGKVDNFKMKVIDSDSDISFDGLLFVKQIK